MGHNKGRLLAIMAVMACGACLLSACGKQAELPDKTVWSTTGTTVTASPTSSTTPTSGDTRASNKSVPSADIVLVMDYNDIDDGGYNQAIWSGVSRAASDTGQSSAHVSVGSGDVAAISTVLEQTIAGGSKTVVCTGAAFSTALETVQHAHPNTHFLVIDGVPATISSNTHATCFREEQIGYLAGYALVYDGQRDIGFVGGEEQPAIMRAGYGFIRGVDDAAKELGVSNDIYLTYWYSHSFLQNDDATAEIAHWYATGTTSVLSCAGSVDHSVLSAAGDSGLMVGFDVDQSGFGPNVVTSATKNLEGSTYDSLKALKDNDGNWPDGKAGQLETLGLAENGVGLATANGAWRLQNFTVDAYNQEVEKIRNGTVTVSNDTSTRPEASYKVRWKNEPAEE